MLSYWWGQKLTKKKLVKDNSKALTKKNKGIDNIHLKKILVSHNAMSSLPNKKNTHCRLNRASADKQKKGRKKLRIFLNVACATVECN